MGTASSPLAYDKHASSTNNRTSTSFDDDDFHEDSEASECDNGFDEDSEAIDFDGLEIRTAPMDSSKGDRRTLAKGTMCRYGTAYNKGKGSVEQG